MQRALHVIEHPLVQHKLTLLRRASTSTLQFRELLRELSILLTYEATRDLPMQEIAIETPLEPMRSRVIDGKKIVLVSILRAGNGLLDGMLQVIPNARVGYIGLYRDPETLQPVEYYFKMPPEMESRDVLVLDPMLATGNSAVAALTRIQRCQPRSIRFLCIVACPEGIQNLHAHHPDVAIYTPVVDRGLNAHAYIVPGLGDAGDRIYGTR
jgi:uracil phosphoribosyltransferase